MAESAGKQRKAEANRLFEIGIALDRCRAKRGEVADTAHRSLDQRAAAEDHDRRLIVGAHGSHRLLDVGDLGFLRLLPDTVGDIDQIDDRQLIRAAHDLRTCQREDHQRDNREAQHEAGKVAPAPETHTREAEIDHDWQNQQQQQRQRRGKGHQRTLNSHSMVIVNPKRPHPG